MEERLREDAKTTLGYMAEELTMKAKGWQHEEVSMFARVHAESESAIGRLSLNDTQRCQASANHIVQGNEVRLTAVDL